MPLSTDALKLLSGLQLPDVAIHKLANYASVARDLEAFSRVENAKILIADVGSGTRYDDSLKTIFIELTGNIDETIASLVHELKHAVGLYKTHEFDFYNSPQSYSGAELRNEAEAQLAEVKAIADLQLNVSNAHGDTRKFSIEQRAGVDFNYIEAIRSMIASDPSASEPELIHKIANEVCRDIGYKDTTRDLFLTYDEVYRWGYLVGKEWITSEEMALTLEEPSKGAVVEGRSLNDIALIKSLTNSTFNHLGVSGADSIGGSTFLSENLDSPELMVGFAGNDVILGTSGRDFQLGGQGQDVLIGNGGDDILIGGFGSDFLKGGSGFDKYFCTFNDPNCSNEVIDDTDGIGEIQIDGDLIKGGAFVSGRTWLDSKGKYYLVESSSASGSAWLTIMPVGNLELSINIRDWRHGETRLGITLEGGNRDPLSIEVSDPGTAKADYRSGDDVAPAGNAAARSIASIIAAVPQPLLGAHLIGNDGADNLRGKTGEFSDILEGGAGNDLINGAGGRDELFGDAGDDMITGFGDESIIHGGSGNDYISAIQDSGWRLTSLMPTIVSAQSIWEDAASYFNWHVEQNAVPVEGEINFEVTWLTLGAGFSVSGASSIEGAQFWFWDNNDGATYSLKYQLADWDESAIVVNYGSVLSRSVRTLSEFETGVSLHGDGGNDFLVGSEGSDTLDGDADDDSISGREGNDSLNGGSGADTIYGGSGNDFVDGDEGVDKIYGGKGNDFLSGGQGDDEVYGDDNGEPAGNDYLNGNDGNDILMGAAGNDVLEGGDGDDELSGDSAQTEDSLCGDDILVGGAGNDKLFGNGGNDVLEGGEGTDFLNGGRGNDALSGGSGLNYYQFSAGFGQDSVRLQIGADEVIQFFDGSTVGDLVFEKSDMALLITTRSGDTVQVVNYFAPGMSVSIWCQSDGSVLTPDDFSTNDLFKPLIAGSAANDTLVGTGIDERLSGLGGSDTLDAGAGDDVLIGGAGDDLLRGGAGANAYRFSSGWGNDTIDVTEGASEIVVFDSTVEKSSIEFTLDTTASLRIRNGQIGDEIVLLSFDERITSNVIVQFSDGTSLNRQDIYSAIAPTVVDVTLDGTPEKDVLVGNALDNIISGDFGNDLILGGDGDDFINAGPVQNEDPSVGRSDADTVYGQSGNDTIYGLDDSDYLDGGSGADKLYGGKGSDVLIGGAGDDVLFAGQWIDFNSGPGLNSSAEEGSDDVLVGGAGNDSLEGGAGKNTYVFSPGFGHDTLHLFEGEALPQEGGGIQIGTKLGENAKLQFGGGIKASDINFSVEGHNLRVIVGSDTLLIEGFYNLSLPTVSFAFDDGSHLAQGQLPLGVNVQLSDSDDTYVGTDAPDKISGGAGNDTLYGGGGNDSLWDGFGQDIVNGNDGDDTLYATVDTSIDQFLGGNGNDIYVFRGLHDQNAFPYDMTEVSEAIGEGTDTLITDFYSISLPDNVENMTMAFRDDQLFWSNPYGGFQSWIYRQFKGNALNNVIRVEQPDSIAHRGHFYLLDGGAGGDTLMGSGADEIYVVDSLNDVIVEPAQASGYDSNDTVRTPFSISIENSPELENIELTQGGAEATGNTAANTLNGYMAYGANTLIGLGGNDTYIVDYMDTIVETANGGQDTVIISRFDRSNYWSSTYQVGEGLNVETYQVGDDVSDSNGVTLLGSYAGDTLIGGKNVSSILSGGAGNDTLIARATSEYVRNALNGDEGDDHLVAARVTSNTLRGGRGNDDIQISNGEDTIYFEAGDGTDVIHVEGSGYEQPEFNSRADGVSFGTSINPADVVWSRSGNDLVVTFINLTDKLTVKDYWCVTLQGQEVISGVIDNFYFKSDGSTHRGGLDRLPFVNNAPVAHASAITISVTATESVTFALPAGTFTDEPSDSLTYSFAGAAPSWLAIDSTTGQVSGSAPSDASDVSLRILAADTWGQQAGVDFNLNVRKLLVGTAGDDQLIGTVNADDIRGMDGNDTLDGQGGKDCLAGGQGDDTYILRDPITEIVELANQGYDTVNAYASTGVIDNVEAIFLVEGSAAVEAHAGLGAQRLTGNSLGNVLDGGSGADTLIGGAGNDIYWISDAGDTVVENADEGDDTVVSSVSYTLTENVENLSLTETAQDANLTGNTLDNVLTGNAYANILDGGAGSDTMEGGRGDDTYYVDSSADQVSDSAGVDTIIRSYESNYYLQDDIENLQLIGTAKTAVGNENDNVLVGNALNNTLLGLEGADTLIGGAGDDKYVLTVDGNTDIIDNTGGGVDWVMFDGGNISASQLGFKRDGNDLLIIVDDDEKSPAARVLNHFMGGQYAISYVQPSAQGEYALTKAQINGKAAAYGTGYDTVMDGSESADSSMVGTSGTDWIRGLGGDDQIFGNSSDDLLQGGDGNDYLAGGLGNDTNTGNDRLEGGNGNDTLVGQDGDDSLVGGVGNDTYMWDSGLDVIDNTGGGTDTLFFPKSIPVTRLTFKQDGNDLLILVDNNPAQGVRVLNHFLGGDYALDNVYQNGGSGYNTTQMNQKAALAGYDNLVQGTSSSQTLNGTSGKDLMFGGGGNDIMNGAAGDDRLLGEAGNDTLYGGVGTDKLEGGLNDDTYTIDDSLDLVIENANEGNDLVNASVSYTLTDNVERLTLTGTAVINGTGNAQDNILTGNSAANVLTGGAGDDSLDGGAGNDTLVGGMGNDIYVVNATGDMVTEAVNEGVDTVKSSVTYSLGNNVENLILTGTTAINGTGNTLDNALTGNSGNNGLVGNAGNDTLEGGAGTDSLTGGTGSDIYRMGRGFGADTVIENDATAGNFDVASFLSGVTYDQLWFQKPTSTNDLKISIIGTNDSLTIKSWYSGSQYQVEEIQTADGYKLTAAKVQTLVTKMATMTKPTGKTLTSSQRSQLASTFASTWTSGSQVAGRSMNMSTVDTEIVDTFTPDSALRFSADDAFSNDKWFGYGDRAGGRYRKGNIHADSSGTHPGMATSSELQRLIEAMAQSHSAKGVHTEILDVNAGTSDLISRKSFGVAPTVRVSEWV